LDHLLLGDFEDPVRFVHARDVLFSRPLGQLQGESACQAIPDHDVKNKDKTPSFGENNLSPLHHQSRPAPCRADAGKRSQAFFYLAVPRAKKIHQILR
jgi:hypothetical protein